MRKYFSLFFLTLALSGCAMQLNQPAIAPSPTPRPISSVVPQGTHIPVTWSNLKLTGKLVYISQEDTPDQVFFIIQMLDLATGQLSTLFKAPDHAFIYALTVSPDYKQLIMSYAPAPANVNASSTFALYIMPLDGSAPPKLLSAPSSKDDQYFQPLWVSLGGKDMLYFVHAHNKGPSKTGTQNLEIELYRMALPDGPQEKIVSSAFWPTISSDGTRLVYVAIDPDDGTNKLIAANPDGSNPQPIAATGTWVPRYIDAPAFLPDGKTILFSAVSLSPTQTPALTWLEQLLGVSVASAHNVPSDWWSVPVDGGPVKQLTHLQTTALFASVLPDQKHLASYSGSGLFVMNFDGTGLQMLDQNIGGTPSTLHWIP